MGVTSKHTEIPWALKVQILLDALRLQTTSWDRLIGQSLRCMIVFITCNNGGARN